MSRKSLQKLLQNQPPIFNDNHRFDGHLEAICLSIGFPNYKMFYRLNQKNPRDWVVLVIEPYILWEFDCAFYRENAASNIARTITPHQRKEYSSFVEMFSNYNHNRRQDLGISSYYPTNPQAEVLVFESINPTYIHEAHFRDKATMQNWHIENKEHFTQKFETNSLYFTPRDDWAAWKSNTGEHVLVPNSENDFTF